MADSRPAIAVFGGDPIGDAMEQQFRDAKSPFKDSFVQPQETKTDAEPLPSRKRKFGLIVASKQDDDLNEEAEEEDENAEGEPAQSKASTNLGPFAEDENDNQPAEAVESAGIGLPFLPARKKRKLTHETLAEAETEAAKERERVDVDQPAETAATVTTSLPPKDIATKPAATKPAEMPTEFKTEVMVGFMLQPRIMLDKWTDEMVCELCRARFGNETKLSEINAHMTQTHSLIDKSYKVETEPRELHPTLWSKDGCRKILEHVLQGDAIAGRIKFCQYETKPKHGLCDFKDFKFLFSLEINMVGYISICHVVIASDASACLVLSAYGGRAFSSSLTLVSSILETERDIGRAAQASLVLHPDKQIEPFTARTRCHCLGSRETFDSYIYGTINGCLIESATRGLDKKMLTMGCWVPRDRTLHVWVDGIHYAISGGYYTVCIVDSVLSVQQDGIPVKPLHGLSSEAATTTLISAIRTEQERLEHLEKARALGVDFPDGCKNLEGKLRFPSTPS